MCEGALAHVCVFRSQRSVFRVFLSPPSGDSVSLDLPGACQCNRIGYSHPALQGPLPGLTPSNQTGYFPASREALLSKADREEGRLGVYWLSQRPGSHGYDLFWAPNLKSMNGQWFLV